MHLYSVGKFGSSPLVFSQLKQYFKNGDTCRLSKKYKKPYCSFCQISQMVTLPKTKSIIIDMLSELLQAWQRAFISPNRTCGSTFLDTFDFFLPIYPLYTSLLSLYIALSFWDTVLTKNIQYETFWQWCLFSVEFHKDSSRFSHASRVQVCFYCSLVFWDLDLLKFADEWRYILVVPRFTYYEWRCHKHLCAGFSVKHKFSSLWDKCPEVQLLGRMVVDYIFDKVPIYWLSYNQPIRFWNTLMCLLEKLPLSC